MKIYLAGTSVSSPLTEKAIQSLFSQKNSHKLHSYYHCRQGGFEHAWFEVNMKNKVDLFLDSGGYSAFSQGAEINIQEYITFIKEHEDILEVYANLDVIGDPKGTWKNQKIMERAGLNPLPIFHYGSDETWLLRYLNEGYEYLALGGMVPISTPALKPWLDRIFSQYICDESGMPKVKVHGFGLTSLRLMLEYPWYSVDSTSWVMTGRMGKVYVPRIRAGQYLYGEDSWKISVSSRSPGIADDPDHIKNLKPMQQKIILDYIHSKGYVLGVSSFKTEAQDYVLKENEKWAEKKPKDKGASRQVEIIEQEGISNKYQLRDELNIIYFLDLEKSMPKWPWAFKLKGQGGGLGLI